MKIPGPLIKGKFVERPNRFLTRVELNGKIVDSHLPNPGRLRELLVVGAELYLRPVPPESERKTRYTTVMVKHDGTLISLVSALPNSFVQESLEHRQLPLLKGYRLEQAEVSLGRHRLDFLLKDPDNKPFYLEVKSVTLVEDGIAQFPDAVTERGTRHVKTLENMVHGGQSAGVLFVCQRPDAQKFRPMHERDPRSAAALKSAVESGVKVWCITTKVTLDEMIFWQEIPVYFND